ncbi:MAG: tyrosine-type recombinase/integrase [Planctomycetota bacterium]|jgi:integrase
MRAWTFQDTRQKRKLGDKAPWSVGWYDPDGAKRSKRIGAKSMAEKYQRKLEGELAGGTYQNSSRKAWSDFRAEYEEKILPRLAVRTQRVVVIAFNHFERISQPKRVDAIKTQTVDEYVAQRRTERGLKRGSKLSPGTINRELRHLKSALQVANDWGYLPKVPKFRWVRESEEIGRVMTPEHFQVIYEACDAARLPRGLHCDPAEWWRAMLAFALTTGWRVEEILLLRRDDLDFRSGAIVTRAADNKGGRDDQDYLPSAVLELVKAIVGFEPVVFFWPHSSRVLWMEFARIQQVGGIHLPCPGANEHECSPTCHTYGFHAIRRGYATLNADTMPAPVLQRKMRHRSFTTTLRYISLADKMKQATDRVYVPEFLKRKAT